jgi:hypothetical protein
VFDCCGAGVGRGVDGAAGTEAGVFAIGAGTAGASVARRCGPCGPGRMAAIIQVLVSCALAKTKRKKDVQKAGVHARKATALELNQAEFLSRRLTRYADVCASNSHRSRRTCKVQVDLACQLRLRQRIGCKCKICNAAGLSTPRGIERLT